MVDDDADLRADIAAYLSQHNLTVLQAADATEMDAVLAKDVVELIVLDLMMPGEDGFSICRRLADAGGPPVIMLSAMGEDVDRIVGLELGADDFLPKPCNPRELLARVKAVLRRREDAPGRPDSALVSFRGFTLHVVQRRLRAPAGTTILLTHGEFSLLCAFLEHPRRILSREQLLTLTRGADTEVFDRSVDVQISRLRRKLQDGLAAGDYDEMISTHRGAGYMLNTEVSHGRIAATVSWA